MRQVDQDELTYALFSAMRGWSVSVRRYLFQPKNEHDRRWPEIIGKQISQNLGLYHFIDADGRVLGADDRMTLFAGTIESFPGAVGKLWLSPQHERQRDARLAAAVLMHRALEPYEVLTDAPYGTTLFFPDLVAPAYAFAATWP